MIHQLLSGVKPAIMASWHSHGNLSPFSPSRGDNVHTLCQRLDKTQGTEGAVGTVHRVRVTKIWFWYPKTS